ncbi:hypothetical protein E8E13_005948 [Curvularia kusanoi]|uniref:Uncharacterized protein n=1 Tax=Curvularia kusanoi TaxID=90978 RepID=A0A9P4T9R1_CURKU|nr:hypothetical protein E8E13_005948 [Curvularia kusanoi]
MARLSQRISRFIPSSISRRSSSSSSTSPPPPAPKICKSSISHPIPSDADDTHGLLCSPTLNHQFHTHGHSSSTYTISDAELRALEEEKLGLGLGRPERERRAWDVESDIDEILAQYASSPPPPITSSSSSCFPSPPPHHRNYSRPTNHFADLADSISSSTEIRVHLDPSSSPSSSTYSTPSPPDSPPTISAKLQRFRDTPPPAPGWEKVSFGRQTRLFGPEGFVDLGGGGGVVGRLGVRDWRGEFGGSGGRGRRGYGVL